MTPARKILVVDDNLPLRKAVGEILALSGYEVVEAENGRDALERLSACSDGLGLILLDLMMPVMNGVELMSELEARYPTRPLAPIVLMSAHPAIEGVAAEGAAGYLPKPFTMAQLTEVVSRNFHPSEGA